ncbi:MAG: glycine-rich protein [bacterium]|nr:glycine-rich protein [bacterium]
MKRKIYKLVSGAKQGLFALALVVSGTAHSQLSYTIAYTGAVQTLTLPAGFWGIACWGANGGDVTAGPGGAGKGGYSRGEFNVVTPGTQLNIFVGGKGVSASGTSGPAGNGGWNGGGGGGYCGKSGGGGGGATDVRVGGIAASNRIIVAGGGGGAAYYNQLAVGGNGGAVLAQNGDFITSGNVTTLGGGGAGANGGSPGVGGFGYPLTDGLASGGGGGGHSPTGFGTQGTGGGAGGYGGTSAGGATGGAGGGGGGYAGGAGGTQTVNAGVGGGGGSSYIGGVTTATTIMFGQPGFTLNPDVIGNGRVVITELCNITLYGAGNTNSLNPMICAGQSVTLVTNAISNYSWSTGAITSSLVVSPTSNTVYVLTATSPSNCTTSRTITISVNSGVPVLSISNPSNNICLGRTVSLTATGALTYTWTNPGVVNGQSFTPSATQIYTVSGQNGCGITTSTTSIVVAPLPVSALANPTIVCEGFAAVLSASSSVTGYTWQPAALFGPTISVAPMASIIYTVTASDGTCSGTQTLALATKVTPTITASTSASMICPGNSVVLTAGGGTSYNWMPGNLSGQSVTVTPATSTLYQLTGTNSVGCYNFTNQGVIVNSSPTVNIAANKIVVCSGDAVQMLASGANTYAWTGGPSTAGYTINPLSSAVYTVTGTQTGNICTSSKTIAITAVVSNVSVSSNTSVCPGGTATLTASGASSYVWNGIPQFGNGIFQVTPSATTVYTVVATTSSNSINCPVTKTVQVGVFPTPTISIVPTKSLICKAQSNTLTATGAVTYTWGAAGSGSVIVVKPNTTTIYTAIGIDANGCVGTQLISVIVNACLGLSEMANGNTGISIYPNPSNGEFTIETNSNMVLKLVNAIGQEVRVITLTDSNNYTAHVKDLDNGVYFIVGQNADGKVSQKVVVAK